MRPWRRAIPNTSAWGYDGKGHRSSERSSRSAWVEHSPGLRVADSPSGIRRRPQHRFPRRPLARPPAPPRLLSSPSPVRTSSRVVEKDDALAHRDRAAVWFYLYTGARIGTGCKIRVEDCRLEDAEDPYVLIEEKGKKKKRKRRIGIHHEGAEVLQVYLRVAGLTSGPLFRARHSYRSRKLSETAIEESTMYRMLQGYLEQLPRAMREVEHPDGTTKMRCDYTPHSLRATQADAAGAPITAIQELLGHKQVKTTQVYIKRKRSTKESASHLLPY